MFLLVSALPVLLRRQGEALDSVTERDDAPARLLQWAVGLLAAERGDWGQAMVGELDRIERRSEPWRFALGCVGGVVLLPPRGRVGAPMGALVAVALGGVAVIGLAFVRYGLGTDAANWVMLAILLVLVVGFILAGSVLLRRPGVAGPGLVRGLFVAAAWLLLSESTIAGFLSPTGRCGHGPARHC